MDAAADKILCKEIESTLCWHNTIVYDKETGTALFLESIPEFYEQEDKKRVKNYLASFSISNRISEKSYN